MAIFQLTTNSYQGLVSGPGLWITLLLFVLVFSVLCWAAHEISCKQYRKSKLTANLRRTEFQNKYRTMYDKARRCKSEFDRRVLIRTCLQVFTRNEILASENRPYISNLSQLLRVDIIYYCMEPESMPEDLKGRNKTWYP